MSPSRVCLFAFLAVSLRSVEGKVLVTAENPDPERLPTLGVWQTEDKQQTLVSAAFGELGGDTLDTWCYESAVDFLGARKIEGGGVELRHRERSIGRIIVTVARPLPGAVILTARLAKPVGGNAAEAVPYPNLNACWQLRRSASFASRPDPYPKFVERCFLFTAKGRTFLHETERLKIPVRTAEHRYNNPPWVQMYVRVPKEVPATGPTAWASYSPTRYIVPVIGTVSRDGKYLAALVSANATVMAQAWHDCMHNNPEWMPERGSGEKIWRIGFYVLPNDAGALMERVGRDFLDLDGQGDPR